MQGNICNLFVCNLFTHGVPRSSQEFVQKCRAFQDLIGIWKCWFLRRGENRGTRRKTFRSRVENQQQTQPTYDAGSGNRTRDTLVGGERSHHCAIPAALVAQVKINMDHSARLVSSNRDRFPLVKARLHRRFFFCRGNSMQFLSRRS